VRRRPTAACARVNLGRFVFPKFTTTTSALIGGEDYVSDRVIRREVNGSPRLRWLIKGSPPAEARRKLLERSTCALTIILASYHVVMACTITVLHDPVPRQKEPDSVRPCVNAREKLALNLRITFYVVRSPEDQIYSVQVPSDDCEILAIVPPPASVYDQRAA
jgi:hypothetical protein